MTATVTADESSEDLTTELAHAANELLASIMTRTHIRADIDHLGFSRAAWTAIAEAGWFEASLDEEHGGLGLGLGPLAAIAAAAGKHLLPGPVAEHAGVLPLLVPRVSASARHRLLDAIAGRRIAVLVDGAAADTPSRIRPQLANGRLSGTVNLARFAELADDLLVVADRTDGPDQGEPTLALVSRAADGVTITGQDSYDPITRYATVTLDVAPVDDVLAAAGPDTIVLLAQLRAVIRLFAAAETAGVGRALLDTSVAYAQDREQFGKPIGAFQAVQHLLADMAAAVLLLEAATADVFGRATENAPLEPLSWQLKCLTARVGRQLGEGALQVHGGIAFTIEHELHRAVQHILALQGLYGDEKELARQLGRALLLGELEPWA
jgi:alkylation response protein AidB-like acyl-CoA dehydrogenase